MNTTTIYKLHKLEIIYKSHKKTQALFGWLGLEEGNLNAN